MRTLAQLILDSQMSLFGDTSDDVLAKELNVLKKELARLKSKSPDRLTAGARKGAEIDRVEKRIIEIQRKLN